MDHSVWALQSRWFAHHGYRVLAARSARPRRLRGPASRRHRRARGLDGRADRGAGRQGGDRRPFDGRADRAERRRALSRSGLGRSRSSASARRMPVHRPTCSPPPRPAITRSVDMVSLWGLGRHGDARRQPIAGPMDAGRLRTPAGARAAGRALCRSRRLQRLWRSRGLRRARRLAPRCWCSASAT